MLNYDVTYDRYLSCFGAAGADDINGKTLGSSSSVSPSTATPCCLDEMCDSDSLLFLKTLPSKCKGQMEISIVHLTAHNWMGSQRKSHYIYDDIYKILGNMRVFIMIKR